MPRPRTNTTTSFAGKVIPPKQTKINLRCNNPACRRTTSINVLARTGYDSSRPIKCQGCRPGKLFPA